MAIANGTCVSFCSQPKAHFGLPSVRLSGTIAVNVTWMKRGFNACQTHCCMYRGDCNRGSGQRGTVKYAGVENAGVENANNKLMHLIQD